MAVRHWVFIGIFLIFVSSLLTLSFAAPTAELARDSTVNIASDNTALVQLQPSPSYDFVKLDPNGNITASPTNLGADSINSQMTLNIGDSTNPNGDYAFTIKNTQSKAVQYDIKLQQQGSFTGSSTDVQYTLQKNTGNPVIVSANNTQQSFIVQPNDVIYGTITIDSTGQSTGNLDTTLVINAKTN